MRILLVEDHAELASLLHKSLGKLGFAVDRADKGETAFALLSDTRYDLMLLDLSLPGIDGLDVLRRARARGDTLPVLVLTARSEVADRIRGLDLGADDYLAKPFDLGELEARVKALLRRRLGDAAPETTFHALSFDSVNRLFSIGGAPLTLTRREQTVLETLFARAGRVVTRERLLQQVFSIDDDVNPETIELYVSRVRKKLRGSGLKLTAVRGIGYLLEAEDAATARDGN